MTDDLKKLSNDEFNSKYQETKEKIEVVLTDGRFIEAPDSQQKLLNKYAPGKNSEEALVDLDAVIFEYLRRQLKELTILIYLCMDKSEDWGVMGEQQISISLCRNLLEIPNDRGVTQFDADRFRRLIDEVDDREENKPADYYLQKIKTGSIDFFGVEIAHHSLSDIDKHLEKIGSKFSLIATQKVFPQFILAKKKRLKVNDDVFVDILGKEYIRSPYYVLSIAAESQAIPFVRKEACEVIFFNKWQKYFSKTKIEHKRALQHPNSAIAEGVKQKALELYDIRTQSDIKAHKDAFINDMVDGIIWHETGHKVQNLKLNPILKCMGNHFVGTEYFPTVLNEALADWAPYDNKMKGAFIRFMEIAKKDPTKASRVVFVYLSDNWFVDDKEEFMGLQTDILTALALYFINNDGSIDLKKLEEELQTISDFLIKVFESMMEKVFDVFKNAKFNVARLIYDFDTMEKQVEKIYEGSRNERPIEELRKFNDYWVNMFAYLKKFSPESNRKLEEYLEVSSSQLRLTILKNITKGNPEKYNSSLRDYITERYKEIGILKEPKVIDWHKAVGTAMSEIKLPDEISQKVKAKFEKIMAGEEYDISINYEGKKDPFIATIQNMLAKSNYGSIKAPIVLGEDIKSSDSEEIAKEKIREDLDTLRDQLDSEMYLEIKELLVSAEYKDVINEVLPQVTLYDGTALKDRIESLKVAKPVSGAPIEVYIPLKIGYMDWNTSQAVWRINQDLRPEEFIMQWTIDHHFLEELVEAYS